MGEHPRGVGQASGHVRSGGSGCHHQEQSGFPKPIAGAIVADLEGHNSF